MEQEINIRYKYIHHILNGPIPKQEIVLFSLSLQLMKSLHEFFVLE